MTKTEKTKKARDIYQKLGCNLMKATAVWRQLEPTATEQEVAGLIEDRHSKQQRNEIY
jgi:hypothetical protein